LKPNISEEAISGVKKELKKKLKKLNNLFNSMNVINGPKAVN